MNKNRNIVLVCKSENYGKVMDNLHKALSKKFKKICIVAVNKPAIALIEEFKSKGINDIRYFFIDCTAAQKTKALKGSVYISGPSALTELAIAISKMLKTQEAELVILDGISSLLVYNDEVMLTKFLHNIMLLIQAEDKKAIYTILQKDMKGLIKDISLFTDLVTEY